MKRVLQFRRPFSAIDGRTFGSIHAAMAALQGSHDGEKILEAILREGRSGQNGVDGAAAGLFASRVQDKRLQLANQDRARFVARPDSLAHRQQAKRDKRVVKQRGRGLRQSSPALAAHESGEKGEERGPLSRRHRQRLGLEETDWNLTFESLAPIHQLWLDYIHRLLGFIDEKGAVQSNQFRLKRGIDGASDEVSMNANAVTAFQTSVVKADLCGAPMRGQQAGCSMSMTSPSADLLPPSLSHTRSESLPCRHRGACSKGDRVNAGHCHPFVAPRRQERQEANQE